MKTQDIKNRLQNTTIIRDKNGVCHIKLSPEQRFEQIIEGYGTDMDNVRYPDSLFIHDKHGNLLFEYVQKSGYCWTSYPKIWEVFESEYGYNYDEISGLIVGMVEQHFNWMGVTPIWSNGHKNTLVEQHFNWMGVTPLLQEDNPVSGWNNTLIGWE